MAVQADGKILLAGSFTDVDVADKDPLVGLQFGVARLTSDGVLDPTLTMPNRTGSETAPNSFARLDDGSTWVAFETYRRRLAPSLSHHLGRLMTDGQVDSTFSLGSAGFPSQYFLASGMEPTADGRFFVWGTDENSFLSYSAFLDDGSKDDLFSFDGFAGPFQAADALADGKLLLSAGTDPQATVDSTLLRLKRSGRRDSSFQVDGVIRSAQVVRDQNYYVDRLAVGSRVLAIQPDGKIIFEYLSSDEQMRLVRLQPDGSLDSSFGATAVPPQNLQVINRIIDDPGRGRYSVPALSGDFPFLDASVQSDGRILIVGPFTSFNGTAARGIIRLNADGTVDPTFTSGGGAQWTQTVETSSFFPKVEAISIQNDGKLLLVGTFEAFNGVPAPGIVSLNPDGSVDPAFVAPVRRQKYSRLTTKMERQADGSVLLAGAYSFPNENESRFIRLENLGGVPIVGSPTLATARVGEAFSYAIVASGQPTQYGAAGLPAGFNLDSATGLISGSASASQAGTYAITLTASNAEGTSAPRALALTIPGPVSLVSAVSRRGHSTVGFFDIDLPQTGSPGVECRLPDNAGFHNLVLTFSSELASVGSAAVTTGSGVAYGPFIDSMDQHLYKINLRDLVSGQEIVVTLTDVTDSLGGHTPAVTVRLAYLIGDVNGSRRVNASDVGQAKAGVGQPLSAGNFRADVNCSGSINATDVSAGESAGGRGDAEPGRGLALGSRGGREAVFRHPAQVGGEAFRDLERDDLRHFVGMERF